MMELSQVVFLALLQGITEFLPISSSAHLILVAEFGGWGDQGLPFDVAVHLGTLSAVCLYFRQDLGAYLSSGVDFAAGRGADAQFEELLKVSLATLPVVIGGLLFKDLVEGDLRSLATIAWATIGFGLVLGIADRFRGEKADVSWLMAGLIGLAQMLALIPGTSRSGITISAALLLGLSRTSAARFSFLLSIPVIILATGLSVMKLLQQALPVDWLALLLGTLLSGLSAYACIHLFLRFIERIGMLPFVIYRLLLGVALLFWAV